MEIGTVVCQRHSVSQSKECFDALAGSTSQWAEAWLIITIVALFLLLCFVSLLEYYRALMRLK